MRRSQSSRLAGLAAVSLLTFACKGDDSEIGLFGDGSGADDGGDGADGSGDDGDGGGGDDGGDDGGGDDGDDGVRFDIGDPDDGTGGPGDGTEGCTKIDFLFVVDNSGSMGAHQTSLINAFPAFIDTIFDTVQAQDFQILVADSDSDGDISGACEPCSPNSFWCGDWCTAKNNLDVACETTMGSGEVAPYNNAASNRDCGVPGGRRYLTSDLSRAEITDKFACMAKVGIFGSGAEQPMTAAAEAVTTQNQAGACNEGFVREDSVLVVTIITDDYPVPGTADDASTVGTPQQWRDAIVSAKGGNQDHVVMLGIINTADATCVSGAGDPIVHPTDRFVEFVGLFGGRGLTGNICDPDYNGFFEQAVELIDSACDEFVPEG